MLLPLPPCTPPLPLPLLLPVFVILFDAEPGGGRNEEVVFCGMSVGWSSPLAFFFPCLLFGGVEFEIYGSLEYPYLYVIDGREGCQNYDAREKRAE